MNIILIDPAADLLAKQLRKIAPHIGIVGKYTQGLVGLEAALLARPDAVFLNLDLPETSGLELLQKLAAASIRVVAASEWLTFERDARLLGAKGFLSLPAAAADFRMAFSKIFGRVGRSRQLLK